jgi:hypothetical protein
MSLSPFQAFVLYYDFQFMLKVNHLIDEINKVIRIKRISDNTWRTFAELNQIPYIGERCFCFEQNTHKWLRALVDSYDTNDNRCRIRYLDTGFIDKDVSLDHLLQWKDFNLSHTIKFQAIQCAIIDFNREDFKKFNFEAKCYFRDNIYGQKFKCKLNEKIQSVYSCSNSDCWLVDLYDLDLNNNQKTINEIIIEKNHDLYLNSATTSFASQDIRLTESNSNIVNIIRDFSYRKNTDENIAVNQNEDAGVEVGAGDSDKKENQQHIQQKPITHYNTDNTDVDVNGEHEKTSDDHSDNIIVKSSMSNERVPILERKSSINIENEVREVLNLLLDHVEDLFAIDSQQQQQKPEVPLIERRLNSESSNNNRRINSNQSSNGSNQSENNQNKSNGHYLSLSNVYDSDADDQVDDKRLHTGRQGE